MNSSPRRASAVLLAFSTILTLSPVMLIDDVFVEGSRTTRLGPAAVARLSIRCHPIVVVVIVVVVVVVGGGGRGGGT